MVMPRHGACWISDVCGDVCVSYASNFVEHDIINCDKNKIV